MGGGERAQYCTSGTEGTENTKDTEGPMGPEDTVDAVTLWVLRYCVAGA